MPGPAAGRASAVGDEFELGGWRVQPSRNRIRRGESEIRLEPKTMDVLVALAARPGEVLSKDDIANVVWRDRFVTDAVVTRAIAGLRRAFADDAAAPRWIETIAKRGYRLLVTPQRLAPRAGAAADRAAQAAVSPEPVASVAHRPSQYAVGQWVTGRRFYGRGDVLAEMLRGPRDCLWLLGARAMGKTSLLHQAAHVATSDPSLGLVPLVWSLQGGATRDDFDAGWRDAVREAAAVASEPSIAAEATAEPADFLAGIGRLRRALRAQGKTLLLLLDEAEALVRLREHAPGALLKLRSVVQAHGGVRCVLAAGGRLWVLAEPDDVTSPFLHGFAPPLYVGALDRLSSAELLRQSQSVHGVELDDAVVETIVDLCGGHPYLLQLVGAKVRELGDARAAAAAATSDRAVRQLVALELEQLDEISRSLLLEIAAGGARRAPVQMEEDPQLATALLHLERLGWIARAERGLALAFPILAPWLRERAAGARRD